MLSWRIIAEVTVPTIETLSDEFEPKCTSPEKVAGPRDRRDSTFAGPKPSPREPRMRLPTDLSTLFSLAVVRTSPLSIGNEIAIFAGAGVYAHCPAAWHVALSVAVSPLRSTSWQATRSVASHASDTASTTAV